MQGFGKASRFFVIPIYSNGYSGKWSVDLIAPGKNSKQFFGI